MVNTNRGRRRLDHMRNDPRVTLTVLAADDWYTHVSLVGRTTEMRVDEGLVDEVGRHPGPALPGRRPIAQSWRRRRTRKDTFPPGAWPATNGV
ncbi:hypothetical protein ACIBI9_60975 [Nonomuraea sp. NPDC050451]|uniref:hypothetical protein n=1 Tax=Nonomuraea sp. NPDC050451 TaxID=3364364 RepID=UPI00378D6BC9